MRFDLLPVLLLIFQLLPAVCYGQSQQSGSAPASLTNSIGMQLALIPAGKFTMGSPLTEAERLLEEVPHEVVITTPFYMGIHEVTQQQFQQIMGEKPRARFSGRSDESDLPMELVTWQEANQFCDKLSQMPEEQNAGRTYRLPTEAEWEYACRAGTTRAFSFGDSLSSRDANFNGNYPYGTAEKGPYARKTTKVGSYPANDFGLFDMHGNVSEWCADWYDANYYRDSPTEDPLGPPVGVMPTDFGNYYLVIRGGSWMDEARACRSAYRFRAMPENRYEVIGFRVVCDTPNGPATD